MSSDECTEERTISIVANATDGAVTAVAAAADEAGSSNSATEAEQQQGHTDVAQHCFTDGLHSLFSFLSLRDLSVVSRCCRSWSAAVSTQPLLRARREIRSSQELTAIARSRLARHIDQLHASDTFLTPLELDAVAPLWMRLPHLTRLHFGVDTNAFDDEDDEEDEDANEEEEDGDGDDAEVASVSAATASASLEESCTCGGETPLPLPATLRELDISFVARDALHQELHWSPVDALLSRLCHPGMAPLTALRLHVGLGSSESEQSLHFLEEQIPVETLRRILVLKESLVEFTLVYKGWPIFDDEDEEKEGRWSQAHIDVFRQLTRLEKLDPFDGRWSDEELAMLTSDPSPAHLHLLPLRSPPATAVGGEALARLPLTEMSFELDTADLTRVPFLSTLERLSLHFAPPSTPTTKTTTSTTDVPRRVDTCVLGASLAQCSRLTFLSLSGHFTNADLLLLLPALPNLRELDVSTRGGGGGGVGEGREFDFGGVSFASSVSHLAETLQTLRLDLHDTPLPLTDLYHLHALRHLRRLHVMLPSSSGSASEVRRAVREFNTLDPTFLRSAWPHMEEADVRRRATSTHTHAHPLTRVVRSRAHHLACI